MREEAMTQAYLHIYLTLHLHTRHTRREENLQDDTEEHDTDEEIHIALGTRGGYIDQLLTHPHIK